MSTVTDSNEPPPSWRERKKQQTRAELIAVSQRQFRDHGYQATTLEGICEEAGVTPQTLLRYFDSKAHLALAPLFDLYEAFKSRLEDPDRTEDAVSLWRANVGAESIRANRRVRAYFGWLKGEPVLRAMADELNTQYEDLLASAICVDADVGPDDFYSMLLATALIRGNAASLRRWTAGGTPQRDLVATQLAVVDFVLDMFPPREG